MNSSNEQVISWIDHSPSSCPSTVVPSPLTIWRRQIWPWSLKSIENSSLIINSCPTSSCVMLSGAWIADDFLSCWNPHSWIWIVFSEYLFLHYTWSHYLFPWSPYPILLINDSNSVIVSSRHDQSICIKWFDENELFYESLSFQNKSILHDPTT